MEVRNFIKAKNKIFVKIVEKYFDISTICDKIFKS